MSFIAPSPPGDLLVYEDKVDENWVRGHHLGSPCKGVLPWNHVWKLPPLHQVCCCPLFFPFFASLQLSLSQVHFGQRSQTSSVNEVIQQGVKALVTKTVTGQLADELSLKKGDIFIIHEVVDELWYR